MCRCTIEAPAATTRSDVEPDLARVSGTCGLSARIGTIPVSAAFTTTGFIRPPRGGRPRRQAPHLDARVDVARDDGAGGDRRVASDGEAVQDQRTHPDVDALVDDRLARDDRPGHERVIGADRRVMSHHRAAVDEHVPAEHRARGHDRAR